MKIAFRKIQNNRSTTVTSTAARIGVWKRWTWQLWFSY